MKGEGVPLNISNKRETVDFEATKNWKGGNASNYKQVKLGLYFYKKGQTIADAKPTSKEYTPEVTNNNGVYTYKWKNQLPKLDIDGTELVYTVRELQDKTDLPLNAGDKVTVDGSNYVVSYNAEMTAVTNTYEVPKTNVTAKKVWVGGKADARPKFYFKLYRTLEGGTEEEVTGAELKEVPKTDGTVEWTNLPATDANAKKYTYSVKETDKDGKSIDETVRGYTPTQTDATTITNTYKLLPTTTDIFVAKELTGKRPTPLQADEFEFILKDEKGTEVQRAKNDANGQVVFKDIPFDKEGLYKFTVVEANGGQTINGVTHDSRSVGVTVSVYDPGQGKLVATPLYDQISALTAPFANFATSDSSLPPGAISVIDNGGIQKFVNTYKATKVKVPVAATKTLINKNTNEPIQLKGGEFEFTLFNEDGNEEKTAKNDKDGNVTFPELEFDKAGTYTYTIKEVKAGTTENGITYDAKTVTATVTVTDDGKGKLSASVAYDGDVTFTNTYTPAKTQVSVTKVWDDDNNQDGLRPTKITVNLLADGVKLETKEIQAAQDGTWSATFTDLPKYKDDKEIKYTVTEEPVEGYVSEITADTATNFTIKNTHAPATVSVQGTKTWDDGNNQDGKRPDKIKVLLNKTVDGVTTKVAEQEVTKANWTYEFKNLPKFEGGKEITYSIDEEAVEGYVKAIDGYNLKNSYTPAKTQIPVKKVWNDADNQDGKRPAKIIVKLLADGQDTGKTLELSEANGWAGSFTELDAHKGGKAIDYKVVEATSITGYTTEVTEDAATGFTITNSYTPETVDIKATKNWDDANNQDGKRPSSITINLLADGEKVDSKEVKAAADGTWSAEFKAKAKYKNGNEIKYTVTEEKVTEYETKIEDFNIINKYIPKAIEYKVTKVWNDANNQDGKRPTTVTVQLYKSVAGSEPVALEGKTLTITAENKTDDNTWVASFTNLPQFENGQEIAYSIQEVNVPEGYTESVTGQVVTNTHEPETIVITGTKKWVDNNNQYGKRTATVKVQILKGNTVVDEVETSEEKGWAFASKPLPKYENGEEIAYKVQEVAVESYESEVKPSGNNQYTITNTLTQKIAIMGQKPWNDTNNQDNIRPTEITVRLLADGKDTDKVATASAATGWKYSFEKLAKYEAGKEITYTVEEVEVPEGYTPKVDGMNITNSHTPEKPQIPQTPPSTPEKSKKRILPSTGSQNSFLAVLAGLFTLSGAAYLLKKKA
ncbi:Collagen adhesin precursor [Streptococcus constellatus]|uniref:Collagen adhesin n=2 Tax=Streptococcus constellatus TaxID=76860 RepID=A0A564TG51_STRCV|nr:Collagen adhesin precursor [Streptococcus gordonii]VUX06330.1 Collagen adhesin precursor [Streptococcus constellatus]